MKLDSDILGTVALPMPLLTETFEVDGVVYSLTQNQPQLVHVAKNDGRPGFTIGGTNFETALLIAKAFAERNK